MIYSQSQKLNAVDILTTRLRKVIQERKKDRFLFLFISILIMDAILFVFLIDGLAALSLGIVEGMFLWVMAKKFDMKV